MKLFLVFKSFAEALTLLKKDHILKLISAIPFAFSVFIYIFLGKFIFTDLRNFGTTYIEQHFQDSTMGTILTSILVVILAVLVFLLINWTFVLLVSIVASPFHDLMTGRVEKILLGREIAKNGEKKGFLNNLISIGKTIFNELKKILFILFLMFLSFLLSFIPLFVPLTIFLSAVLMSVQFLDYSWSRSEYSLKECVNDVKRNFFTYALSGVIFLFLFSLPWVNILFLPFGVIYYSILWTRLKKSHTST